MICDFTQCQDAKNFRVELCLRALVFQVPENKWGKSICSLVQLGRKGGKMISSPE